MSIIIKETVGASVPPGTYLARCFRIVDVGTERDAIYNKDIHKIVFNWELPSLRIEVDGKDLPMSCSKTYRMSLHKQANLRSDLEQWRGRPFTKEELAGFDIAKVLGVACQLQIIETKEGKRRVATIMALPKGTVVPEVENPLVEYSISEGKNAKFEALPDYLKKRCLACLEWTNPKAIKPPEAEPEMVDEHVEDDVPF